MTIRVQTRSLPLRFRRAVGSAVPVAALFLGCGELPAPTAPGRPRPVIQIVLMPHLTEHTATIEYSAPAESIVVLRPLPVPAESVAIAVRTPAGEDVPLMPVAGRPGRFTFTLAVIAGATYHLVGSVAGQVIESHTTVPGPLIIQKPAADTLRLRASDVEAPGYLEVPFAWHAAGADAYLVQVSSLITPQLTRVRILQDTVGVLFAEVDLFPGRPETSAFRVTAFDSATSAYALPGGSDPKPGNISGALGLFGAAVVLDPPKVVLWQ